MKKTLVAVVTGITLFTGVALSQAQPEMDLSALHESGGVMAHFSERLDLTEIQETEIADIFAEAHAITVEDKAQLEALNDQMRALIEDFNEAEALDIAQQIGDISGRLAFARAATRADVRAVLTEDQLAELQAIREAHQERRERRIERRGGSF
jgi:Spy/CpxP family protein refolding chaperone